MERKHPINLGDDVVRLAYHQGLATVDLLWQHPENAELRERRPDPAVLAEGDVVHVPDPLPRTFEHLSTRRMHRLVVPLPLPTLRVRLTRPGGIPLAGRRCTVEMDATRRDIALDKEGALEIELGPDTRRVTLAFEMQHLGLDIAHLQPVDVQAGWRARLENLGYQPGPDAYGVASAIEEFQCDLGLDVDGEMGPLTQAALLEAHGA